jgi:DNA-binding GntR family transcriptional regulator
MTGHAMYQQIAHDLRTKIAEGHYPIGSELPSASQLMQSYGVSSTVVRFAMRELKSEGLVVSQPGKGVYVQRTPDTPQPSPDYTALVDQIDALRTTFDTALDSIRDRLATIETALAQLRDDSANR